MAQKLKLTALKIKIAAVMRSRGFSNETIAARIGVSESRVTAAMVTAEKNGWLAKWQECLLPEAEIALLEQMIYEPRLLAALKQEQPRTQRHLRSLRVFDGGAPLRDPSRAKQYQEYRDQFGEGVAQYLLEHVFPSVQSMGITWGSTLLSVVSGLGRVDRSQWGNRVVDFMPVCGAPPDAIDEALRASSYLVAALDQVLHGENKKNPNNFTGVAASISSQFTAADRRVLEKYFRQNEGYGRVFGLDGVPGLIDTMDAVMTSVGTTNPQENRWIDAAAKAAGFPTEDLCNSVEGNVGGWFLAKPDLQKQQRSLVDAVNARWTGIQPRHHLACNARANGHGGTILIAIGHKAEVVLACVRAGLVSELLIDPVLSADLRQELGVGTETID